MMDTIKVSVIIPVYNTAVYLRQCLDSVIAQTLREIEIICVDDGSTDESPEILDEYAAKDSRIRVLHQENRYAGTARNHGMTVATGKYYAFWDSDDFFKPNALELMYNKSEEDQADVCICSASQYFEDIHKSLPSNGYIKKKYLPEKRPFSQKDIPDHILDFATAHPWNKLFRREFIEGMELTFHETLNGDDIFFVINSIARAERITIVNKPLVCYRINQSRSLYGAENKEPLTPINNWILTRESLIANNAYPKQSFDNKILDTLIYFLHNLRSWDAFQTTFLYIQQEALPKLEVTRQEDGYYYNASNAVCLEHMLDDSPEEFLVFFAHMTYLQLSQKNGNYQTLLRKNRKLRKSLLVCQEEKDSLQTALSISLLDKEPLQKNPDPAAASHTSRIGRVLTAIPRKIKRSFSNR